MPNRLSSVSSPYLRQHADNPVDWYPWGGDAFSRAKSEQKPIFLSIGYATCHWCHVMARESFEDAAIAASLNEHFISIKVDREERPDVDRIYMTYVQALTGRGGWPLSVWLTPDLKPFFGGTYFPPEDRHGRSGFASLLTALSKAWTQHREQLVAEGDRALIFLQQQAMETGAGGGESDERPSDMLFSEVSERAFHYYVEAFDPVHGGFGGAPKFPQPGNLAFLFRHHVRASDGDEQRRALEMATMTLACMCRGGIHDHVGGGYHRYSVDDAWFVPHFEKMLYDQAQIASVALDAWRATRDERFAWMARDILGYVVRDLAHPKGAFYSAEDADSPGSDDPKHSHAEGAFYLWKDEELRKILGSDYALFAGHYGIRSSGNIPMELDPHGEFSGGNHLAQVRDLETTAKLAGVSATEANARLVSSLEKLLEVRSHRARPLRDEKIITAWNGLMISALSKAAAVLSPTLSGVGGAADRVRWHATAARAAEFIRQQLYDPASHRLYRSWCSGERGGWGLASDYAFLIQGLIDLHEVDGNLKWLHWAEELQDSMDAQCLDLDRGGWFDAPASFGDLVLRLKEDHDGAEPSPSSVGAMNLLRLASILGRDDWRVRAIAALVAYRSRWTAHPQAMPWMLQALEQAASMPNRLVALVGAPRDSRFLALSDVIHTEMRGPYSLVVIDPSSRHITWLEQRAPWLAAMIPLAKNTGPAVWLCEQSTCKSAISDPEELKRVLLG